jgi:hypothetical protein
MTHTHIVLEALLKAVIVCFIVTTLSTPKPLFNNVKTTKSVAFLEKQCAEVFPVSDAL